MIVSRIKTVMFVVAIALGRSALTPAQDVPPAGPENRQTEVQVSAQALEIHRAGYVWDGHNDLPWAMRDVAGSSFDVIDIAQPQAQLMTDIPRLRQGNVGAQFWSVFVPVSTRLEGTSLQTTIEQIELVRTMCRRYPETFLWATSIEDIERARREHKIASLIGVEGGHSIENSLANLRRLYDMGARYMTLTHSKSLDWADSATDEAKVGGLSPFGEEVVREMNRLGMLVDLSHVSVDTMRDALRVSSAPVIYSHSSALSLANHPRNVPDEILPLIRENGGVVMVNFFNAYVVAEDAQLSLQRWELEQQLEAEGVGKEESKARLSRWEATHPPIQGTVHDLVDHIDHLVQHCGIDHVGLGSDYDGVSLLPKQIEDVSTYPVITQVLLDRGYTAADIQKILSGNIYRAFSEAEQVAQRYRQTQSE